MVRRSSQLAPMRFHRRRATMLIWMTPIVLLKE
jgi:hypothetical protein